MNTEAMAAVVAVVDGVIDIALQAELKSDFYTGLIRLALKARSFQNPKAEVSTP